MNTSDFVIELKKIDPRLDIVKNPNRPGLSNVKFDGVDLCPVPSDEIREKADPNYYYTFPNGMMSPHNSIEEVIGHVNKTLSLLETEQGREDFFAKE